MHAPPANPSTTSARIGMRMGRLLLLLLPATLLVVVSLRIAEPTFNLLWLGAIFQVLACGLVVGTRPRLRDPVGPAIIMLYVIALSWLMLGAIGHQDWFLHLSQALLLVVPLISFGLQCLHESGAPALRRARYLAQRLANRRDWPAELQACRSLPEVKAFREALQVDASPALTLLSHPRPQVRVAALAALEFRGNWRPQQPEVVLQLAQKAAEPEVRAAAVNALANIEERNLIEALSVFLYDSSRLVRRTATEALLWNTEQHWQWIRLSVRKALADPSCQEDGPLRHEGCILPPEAVSDLTAWSAEKGVLALRAALTLGAHYTQVLTLGGGPAVIEDLRRQLADVHAPVMLRLELARALYQHREVPPRMLRDLLDPANPAPLRLLAVEALLNQGESPEATAALHDLARLPNREMALNIADLVQRRLGVDLGLPREQPLPPIHSRLAAEVARRVLLWATHQDIEEPAGAPTDQTAWPA